MTVQTEDILNYLDFLISKQKLCLTLHGEFACIPELIRYNFHFHPYCQYIKTACACWENCIARQKKVLEACKTGAFYGICYAGAGEYVYPIHCREEIIGFLSISGYRGTLEEVSRSKARHFAERHGLSPQEVEQMRLSCLCEDIPEKAELDTLIRPLQIMLEIFLDEYTALFSSSEDSLYVSVLRYIVNHYTERITAEIISERLHASVSAIRHLFKKRTAEVFPSTWNIFGWIKQNGF